MYKWINMIRVRLLQLMHGDSVIDLDWFEIVKWINSETEIQFGCYMLVTESLMTKSKTG